MIINADSLEYLKSIPDKSVDVVICDPPYGLTNNLKDVAVDLSELFRVTKTGVIVTAQQPYVTDLIVQFRKQFRYDLIWNKVLTSGFLNANRMPLRSHEHILVFGKVKYFPQKTVGNKNHSKGEIKENKNENYGKHNFVDNTDLLGNLKHPKSILTFDKPHPSISVHRTQKPVELMEWLVKSFSEEGDTILDPFAGSGTTGVACKNTNRNYILIEKDPEYIEIIKQRLTQN